MPDIEKVMKGLECCSVLEGQCKECPYETEGYVSECTSALSKDALAMLKQEAVKPVRDKVVGRIWLCGNCGVLITESMNYCPKCGKRIEWEGR